MRRLFIALSVVAITLTSCGSKKKIAELEAKNKEIQDLLNTCTVKLNTCLTEKEALNNQNEYLKKNNSDLINSSKEMTVLTTKGAENLEKSKNHWKVYVKKI
jgi:chemotaxis protein MotB